MRRINEEVFHRGRLDTIDEMLAQDFVQNSPPPGFGNDRAAVKQIVEAFRRAFPDGRFVEEAVTTEGDQVVWRGRFHATHLGPFMRLAPSGCRIDVANIDIVRFRDGLAVEHWGLFDLASLMRQVGFLEGPGT
jgi:predicted ester cyclase